MKNRIFKMSLASLAFSLLIVFVGRSHTAAAISFEMDCLEEVNFGGAYLTFADKFGGEVTQKDLAKNNRVEVAGCAKGSKIFQFSIHITKGGKTTILKTESSNLTEEMLTQLRTLSKGDEFIFKKIKAYLPNGKDVVDVWGKKFVVV